MRTRRWQEDRCNHEEANESNHSCPINRERTNPEEGRELNREVNVEWPKPSSSTLNPRDEYIATFDRLSAQSLAPKTTEVGNAKSISTQQLAQVAPEMLSIKPSVEVQVGQAIIFQAEVLIRA